MMINKEKTKKIKEQTNEQTNKNLKNLLLKITMYTNVLAGYHLSLLYAQVGK